MQTDESRQGVVVAAKVNLAAVKTTLAVARENPYAAVNPMIKWKEEKAEFACCSENPFSLQ